MKVLIIDYSNIFYRTTHSVNAKILGYTKQAGSAFGDGYRDEVMKPIEDVGTFWKAKVLSDIIDIVSFFKPDKVIISFDCYKKPVWRKSVYKKYKSSRASKRDATKINFSDYHGYSNQLISELKVRIPNFSYLEVEECESDDNVAVLVRDVFKDDEVVIFSSDGDFNQLKNERVSCHEFNRKGNRDIIPTKDNFSIDLKIVCGDDGDDIPNIFVMEDVGFAGKTIGVGEVTAIKILEEGVDSEYCVSKVKKKYPKLEDFEIKAMIKTNFERNSKLISFDHIPFDIHEKIKAAYRAGVRSAYKPREFQNYLTSSRMEREMSLPMGFHQDVRNVS